MRQRLQALLPIVLIALAVQMLAPVGAAWAMAAAASDPLRGIEICHNAPAGIPSQQDDSTGQHLHDACVLCCLAQTGSSFDVPRPVLLDAPWRHANAVVWSRRLQVPLLARAGSNTQARAPPAL